MAHDILSDVLRSVRLRGALYFYVKGGDRWVAEAPAARDIAAAVMPGTDHVMEYHLVTRGRCWGAIVGESPVQLEEGDVILFPHGDPHVISSAPGMRADPRVDGYFERSSARPPFTFSLDGGKSPGDGAPEEASLVCGFLGCDLRPFNPLVATLPRMLHLKGGEAEGWTVQFMKHAATESREKRAGSEVLLERMSEMMFVDAVRRYVNAMPEDGSGWLAGMRDRFVGRALALMHEEPARQWSVEELGERVGLSRSALHERFADMIGQPPMQYLANWRMQVASALLRDTSAPVASVAQDVGYDSEAAFARAFKRAVGKPPAAWRRERVQGGRR